jgi:hypothetical protein
MSRSLGGDCVSHKALLEREAAVMCQAIALCGLCPTVEFRQRHGAQARAPPEGTTAGQDPEECD